MYKRSVAKEYEEKVLRDPHYRLKLLLMGWQAGYYSKDRLSGS